MKHTVNYWNSLRGGPINEGSEGIFICVLYYTSGSKNKILKLWRKFESQGRERNSRNEKRRPRKTEEKKTKMKEYNLS